MKTIPYLRFRETSPHDLCFHLVRHTFKPRSSFYRHGHWDFCEVFWVEAGSGLHHVNGIAQKLEAGMLVFIRRSDVHGFTTRRGESLTVVNCSFPSHSIDDLKQRYFEGKPVLFWSRETLPATCQLESGPMQRLQQWTDRLSVGANDRFFLDWFLLDLFHLFDAAGTSDPEGRTGAMPERLRMVLRGIHQPELFTGGVHELAKQSGCSLQHLNRLLKKFGQPPAGDLVGEARLQYAARQLRLTDRKIVDIGLEVGLDNLGHFYEVFKKRYGLTPRQFRLRMQQSVWQGSAKAVAPPPSAAAKRSSDSRRRPLWR